MKPFKSALISGFALALMASVACAGTIGGLDMFPGPEGTMTLGPGDSLRIATEALETPDLQKSDTSLLSRIDLTEIPEPPVYMLLGLGLLFCVQRVLRRRRGASK